MGLVGVNFALCIHIYAWQGEPIVLSRVGIEKRKSRAVEVRVEVNNALNKEMPPWGRGALHWTLGRV